MVVTYGRIKKGIESPPSKEARLLDLLCKAETEAYALAHCCDVGGYTERAYRFMGVAERLGDAVLQVNDLRPMEPRSKAPTWGLRSRAHSLRRLLTGSAWASSSAAPLVPGQTSAGAPMRRREKAGQLRGLSSGG
jgi:hypothetical protein